MRKLFVNRLEKGVGAKDFYIPKNTSELVVPKDFSLSNDFISEEQKDRGIKLVYHPEVYVVKLNQHNEVVLTDFSGRKVEVPTTLASYNNHDIAIKGFMLRIDDELKNSVKHSTEIDVFVEKFKELNEADQQLSAIHELQHDKNRAAFEDIVQPSALTPKQYAKTRIADECSAFTAEMLACADKFKESGNLNDFNSPWFAPLVKELRTKSKIEQNKLVSDEAYLVNKAIDLWVKSPKNDVYMDEKGDFFYQVNNYFNKEENCVNVDESNPQYAEVVSRYFTFTRDGKEVNLSKYIEKDFVAPEHLYKDVEIPYKKKSAKLAFEVPVLER